MLLFVKFTFFLMYLDIFSPFRWMRIACITGGTLCVLFYTAVAIPQFYFATPGPGESFKVHAVTEREYDSNILSIPAAAVGLGFDVYLLILPLIAVSQLKMPMRRKIGTSLLFGTGVL